MKTQFIPKSLLYALLLGGSLASCKSGFFISGGMGASVPITAQYDALPTGGHDNSPQKTQAIVAGYQQKVHEIMSPVVGTCAENLQAYRPESPLANLMADILRESALTKTGQPADVSVMNMGGIRSSLSKGDITYGNIFEVAPFENSLTIVEMNGIVLNELFGQIAKIGGEGISGATMMINTDGKVLSVLVAGEPIQAEKTYRVATIDYLAEGNDKMPAFLKGERKDLPEVITLRTLLLEYVQQCTQQGKAVQAVTEGRIQVQRALPDQS